MDNKKVGQFIKELREEAKLTQQELADEIYVERTTLIKWEKGVNTITATNVKKLADVFKVTADEIISGERLNDQNKERINDVILKVYENNNKLSKKIKIIGVSLLVLILIFLGYFFISFYNSVEIYNVGIKGDEIVSINGNLTKTKDYIYFFFELNDENMENVNLYYLEEDKKTYIIKTSGERKFYIRDYVEYQEYFDFSKFDKIIKNIYLEYELNNELKIVELQFKRDYSNNSIFLKKDSGFASKTSSKDNKYFEYESKIKLLSEKYDGESISIKYEKVNYDIVFFDNNIGIEYKLKEDDIYLSYSIFDDEFIYKKINDKEVYNVCINIEDDSEANEDYELIKEIIDFLIDQI